MAELEETLQRARSKAMAIALLSILAVMSLWLWLWRDPVADELKLLFGLQNLISR